jgi:hypothetical protein
VFFAQVPLIEKPVWAMLFVNDNSKIMNSERLREAARKFLKKCGGKQHAKRQNTDYFLQKGASEGFYFAYPPLSIDSPLFFSWKLPILPNMLSVCY